MTGVKSSMGLEVSSGAQRCLDTIVLKYRRIYEESVDRDIKPLV